MHHWAGSPEERRKTPWTQTQHTCCTTCCEATVEHCNTAWQWYNNEYVQRSINNRTSHWSVFRTSWSSTYTEFTRDKTMQLLLLHLMGEHVCFQRKLWLCVDKRKKTISCICLPCPGCYLKTCSTGLYSAWGKHWLAWAQWLCTLKLHIPEEWLKPGICARIFILRYQSARS